MGKFRFWRNIYIYPKILQYWKKAEREREKKKKKNKKKKKKKKDNNSCILP